MIRKLATAVGAVTAAAVLAGCGHTAAAPAQAHKPARPAPAVTATATAPASAAPVVPVKPVRLDAISQVEQRVATVGLASVQLLTPAADSRADLLRAATALPLTPAALARYRSTLPADGREADTATTDGSAWQLVAFTAVTPGDTTATEDAAHVLAGPLAVRETTRRLNTDGSADVAFTAEQTYAQHVIATGEKQTATMTRHYVLHLVPGVTKAQPWLVASWTGTGTDSGDPKAAK